MRPRGFTSVPLLAAQARTAVRLAPQDAEGLVRDGAAPLNVMGTLKKFRVCDAINDGGLERLPG